LDIGFRDLVGAVALLVDRFRAPYRTIALGWFFSRAGGYDWDSCMIEAERFLQGRGGKHGIEKG
jgi:hypothetical protein